MMSWNLLVSYVTTFVSGIKRPLVAISKEMRDASSLRSSVALSTPTK